MHYTKTDVGNQAFKARSPLLSARQRPAFLLFDGKKTVEQVLHATASLGMTQNDVDYLVELEFLVAVEDAFSGTATVPVFAAAPMLAPRAEQLPLKSDQQRYDEAWPLATEIVDALGMSGYLLSQSVEAATTSAQLLALLPKIQSAAGPKATRELERILNG